LTVAAPIGYVIERLNRSSVYYAAQQTNSTITVTNRATGALLMTLFYEGASSAITDANPFGIWLILVGQPTAAGGGSGSCDFPSLLRALGVTY
jgi:hypothetical protein